MQDNRPWMEVEMDESVDLLRKKLEELNKLDEDELDHEDLECMYKIYKILYYIKQIRKP